MRRVPRELRCTLSLSCWRHSNSALTVSTSIVAAALRIQLMPLEHRRTQARKSITQPSGCACSRVLGTALPSPKRHACGNSNAFWHICCCHRRQCMPGPTCASSCLRACFVVFGVSSHPPQKSDHPRQPTTGAPNATSQSVPGEGCGRWDRTMLQMF